ncbi:hypothetical protein EW146_g7604 [Bondarzewia mesenterica]|uniref:Uncharacterized protein n=1 Tax=Bondarzewia mesenterica TaxID=1095465 RepID=A0A4V3XE73_9AGAM|nr:hypothetical protein EW146_g7604 [Bondarzewia mesenterica]
MSAHLIFIVKLKEVFSDHMKSLSSMPAKPKDYINHLEMLDGFVLDADVTKWVEEVNAALELVTVHEWLEWGMHILPQLSVLVTREHEVVAEQEKVHAQQEQVTAVKVKKEKWLTHCKVHKVEKLALLMANKISLNDFECNSDNDLMLLDLASLGELEGDIEMTASMSETGGDVNGASDVGKGKGHVKKRKTTKVSVSNPVVTVKQSKCTTRDPKVILEGTVLLSGADRCMKCMQDKKRCLLVMDATHSAILTIKVKLAEKKDFSSSAPHLKLTARASDSSMVTTS